MYYALCNRHTLYLPFSLVHRVDFEDAEPSPVMEKDFAYIGFSEIIVDLD